MNGLAALPVSNVPENTVSEICGAVEYSLEGNFGRVRVRGEITELQRYPPGPTYFSLKDEGRQDRRRGVEVGGFASRHGAGEWRRLDRHQAASRPTPERSSFIIERMEYVGAAPCSPTSRCSASPPRGCSTPTASVPCRVLPSVIGAITSKRGAVIQDTRTTIVRRSPRQVLACGPGECWPLLDMARRCAQAAHGTADQADPL